MFAKVLTSALLLLSASTAYAGVASVTLYQDISCGGDATEMQLTESRSSGCDSPYTVAGFRSARLNWSSGLSGVAICPQGYSCNSHINLVPLTGKCVLSPDKGTFDKVQLCVT
jgi:hypothetical protein